MDDAEFLEYHQHNHDGINSKKIDPRNLLGFEILTAVPTHKAEEGTMVLTHIGSAFKLYVRINKTWKSVTLT